MKFPHRGLYAITQPENRTINQVVKDVEAALRGGATVIQYRDKNPLDTPHLASLLLEICHAYTTPLLINDSIELALAVGADGVHLGRDDGEIAVARRLLGPDAIIGVSCYNDVEKARTMAAAGADYVAFGRFFPSGSKPLAAPAEIATLARAKQSLTVPIVAIGGILPENGGQLLAAGADLLAVIGGVFDHEPEAAARAYQALFNHQPE
ncbi:MULTISPECIES: thiamine phosphate synthase [Methylomonas]|uniref:Thiamine-phosphate synthase n=2 Tax=Methylomonas TaxID=416 RepID=A0A126T917_9GAMM|nr:MULTISPECIES: thiamine phosphate synthase [Methylomonas]AMK78264.1 thiamine-phosphate diphosphorylase [Methylomonas denitrificans]OAI03981.1 thiamine phosphate synthase [Methylomonas methanica]TCV87707.1 thiamine-phosphate diphosphorylase [Methylomonas methanica]